MINFLLIGDKNYNLQLVNSINSLANNFDLTGKDSTIYIIHKNPSSFKKYLKYLKFNKIEIIKFKNEFKVLNNVKNSHLSEVTYYRLYIDKLINLKKGFLIYFDADLYFLNNSTKYIEESIVELQKTNKTIAAVEEKIITSQNIEYFNKLGFRNEAYFNAGFIIFNLAKCVEENFFEKLRQRLAKVNFELKYWDQDILNSVVNGRFLSLENKINYGIDLNVDNFLPEDVLAIHYKGKNKPWSIKYAFDLDSKLYQNLHQSNFFTYHITDLRSNIFKFLKLNIPIKTKIKILKIQLLKWV